MEGARFVIVTFLIVFMATTANAYSGDTCCKLFEMKCDVFTGEDNKRCAEFCLKGCPLGSAGTCTGFAWKRHDTNVCECGPVSVTGCGKNRVWVKTPLV